MISRKDKLGFMEKFMHSSNLCVRTEIRVPFRSRNFMHSLPDRRKGHKASLSESFMGLITKTENLVTVLDEFHGDETLITSHETLASLSLPY